MTPLQVDNHRRMTAVISVMAITISMMLEGRNLVVDWEGDVPVEGAICDDIFLPANATPAQVLAAVEKAIKL
jgi:hypothetical protein